MKLPAATSNLKELTIEITNKCALNCLHCSTDASKDGDVFFSIEEVAQYLNRFRDFESVRLSGGEPFQHPQIVDIAALIKEQGKKAYILSCGVLEAGIIDECMFRSIKPFVDEIIFSVHGDWDTHYYIDTTDKNIYRHPAYWDGFADSVDNARYAGIPISFQTVAMNANYHSLESIAKLVGTISSFEKKVINWHVLRFVKQGRGKANSEQALSEEQAQQIPALLEALEHKVNAGHYPLVPTGANVEFTCSNTFYLGKSESVCECGSAKAVVTHYRKVIPCSALKYGEFKGKFPCRNKL